MLHRRAWRGVGRICAMRWIIASGSIPKDEMRSAREASAERTCRLRPVARLAAHHASACSQGVSPQRYFRSVARRPKSVSRVRGFYAGCANGPNIGTGELDFRFMALQCDGQELARRFLPSQGRADAPRPDAA